MKKIKEARLGLYLPAGLMTMLLILLMVLFLGCFSIVSHAESQGTVTANSANIRREPNSSSEVIGSTQKDKSISIRSQTTGSDGAVWYQVFVDADTLGYIRSDLVSITDGTTPPTETYTASGTDTATTTDTNTSTTDTQTTTTQETPAEVTAVEHMSASVTGGQSVRVRSNASTTSQILTTAQNGMALTVTGQATGTDGNVWYQVAFIADGTEVTGFIRSDYVSLSGELVPVTQQPAETPQEETEAPEEVQETKDWETQLQGEEWYLINNVEGNQYLIQDLFDGVEQNAALYEESNQKVSSQRIVIIILVVLFVLAAGAAAFLAYKIKDMMDSAYFSQVERETIRKRSDKAQGNSGQKVMHTVGAGKPNGAKQARPAGARPAGNTGAAQAGRPAGTRPGGAGPAGSQAASQQARPAGTRPAGTRPAAARPAGSGAAAQTARPAAAKPAGSTGTAQAARPAGAKPVGAKPGAGTEGKAPSRASGAKQSGNGQNPGWKSKNFMADDDEFEFEFLNWDGDEEP